MISVCILYRTLQPLPVHSSRLLCMGFWASIMLQPLQKHLKLLVDGFKYQSRTLVRSSRFNPHFTVVSLTQWRLHCVNSLPIIHRTILQ
jgi:hypothetical protein